eukprot:TRINITY_DN16856_c0_g1_i1.p1 TRINITY_DN16856_c0_g1~~TRINITY_DN16856_c0_g1_i1.p1  ORF type:complete len:326 (+),score=99.25 TRINITY_DN16856_c0_g1_i1:88-978(+)
MADDMELGPGEEIDDNTDINKAMADLETLVGIATTDVNTRVDHINTLMRSKDIQHLITLAVTMDGDLIKNIKARQAELDKKKAIDEAKWNEMEKVRIALQEKREDLQNAVSEKERVLEEVRSELENARRDLDDAEREQEGEVLQYLCSRQVLSAKLKQSEDDSQALIDFIDEMQTSYEKATEGHQQQYIKIEETRKEVAGTFDALCSEFEDAVNKQLQLVQMFEAKASELQEQAMERKQPMSTKLKNSLSQDEDRCRDIREAFKGLQQQRDEFKARIANTELQKLSQQTPVYDMQS